MAKVQILGAGGMLGAMLVHELSRDPRIELSASVRTSADVPRFRQLYPTVRFDQIDVGSQGPTLDGFDWVINAIGIIKPYIRADRPSEVERAVWINALFPLSLARRAEDAGCRVIQIATDCVFSGRDGCYDERADHDALDVYGKTKSLGEAYSNNLTILRCSIIGPELRSHRSLLSWFLDQPQHAVVDGYTNHLWNGITTLHFAKMCRAIIHGTATPPRMQHVVPGDDVTKADLLRLFALHYERGDLIIRDTIAAIAVDRRLRTNEKAANAELWRAAGYETPPLMRDLVAEMSHTTLPSL